MNRILAVIVGLAFVALIAFGVVVFTSGGPPAQVVQPAALPQAEAAAEQNAQPVVAPQSPAAMEPQTPEAAARFDAWAKPLREGGLTVTAGRVAVAGETVSVADLTIAGPAEFPGWRWSAERASLYDRELFHLQAAGKTAFVFVEAEGKETVWSGTAEAIGVAITTDVRDKLGKTAVVRINGLSLAREGDAAPLTLADGQLRILLKGGTGILPQGTDLTLRLTDMTLPQAAGAVVGSKLKSFTTEFAIDRSITAYSLQQVADFFRRGVTANVELGAIALDWGALHVIGNGAFGFSPAGAARGRLEVKVTEPVALLDAIAAAGGVASDALADQVAALLLQMGEAPNETAVPMAIVITDGTVVLEGPGGESALGTLPQLSGGAVPPAAVR
ncbi:MAG TPA: DUF2125 domain-containing protein [Devosia sp.]|nr:DUF2125 domain-containing protein [Devosia sp.]